MSLQKKMQNLKGESVFNKNLFSRNEIWCAVDYLLCVTYVQKLSRFEI